MLTTNFSDPLRSKKSLQPHSCKKRSSGSCASGCNVSSIVTLNIRFLCSNELGGPNHNMFGVPIINAEAQKIFSDNCSFLNITPFRKIFYFLKKFKTASCGNKFLLKLLDIAPFLFDYLFEYLNALLNLVFAYRKGRRPSKDIIVWSACGK